MKITLPLLLCCLLIGCASVPEAIKPPADNDRKVHVDERLMEECVAPAPIRDNPQPSDVLDQHKQDMLAFKACSDGKHDLILIIRKAFE
jgi:hypothetical protein